MSNNPFQRAVREGIKIRSLLYGKSGSGKTRTAIQIACHMAELTGDKVAVIDTERGSARRYAPSRKDPSPCLCDRCLGHGLELRFDVVDLEDHRPRGYMQLMAAARVHDYGILVIDSITHEWLACLEEVDQLKATARNKVSPWSGVTAQHDRFIQAIQDYPGHVICTCRAKDKIDAKANSRGLLPIQRNDEGIYYEFDLCAVLSSRGDSGGELRWTKARDTGRPLQGTSYKLAGLQTAHDLVEWAGDVDLEALSAERAADAARAQSGESLRQEAEALRKQLRNDADLDAIEAADDLPGYISWAKAELEKNGGLRLPPATEETVSLGQSESGQAPVVPDSGGKVAPGPVSAGGGELL